MDVEKQNNFKPSPAQEKYLQVFLEQDVETTKQQLAERTGVDRSTVWKWEKDEGFRLWMKEEVDKYSVSYIPKIKQLIFQTACNPKATVQERELALRVQKEYTPETILNIPAININIVQGESKLLEDKKE